MDNLKTFESWPALLEALRQPSRRICWRSPHVEVWPQGDGRYSVHDDRDSAPTSVVGFAEFKVIGDAQPQFVEERHRTTRFVVTEFYEVSR